MEIYKIFIKGVLKTFPMFLFLLFTAPISFLGKVNIEIDRGYFFKKYFDLPLLYSLQQ
jgi:hypothetical protein